MLLCNLRFPHDIDLIAGSSKEQAAVVPLNPPMYISGSHGNNSDSEQAHYIGDNNCRHARKITSVSRCVYHAVPLLDADLCYRIGETD